MKDKNALTRWLDWLNLHPKLAICLDFVGLVAAGYVVWRLVLA